MPLTAPPRPVVDNPAGWLHAALLTALLLAPAADACSVYGKGWGSKWDNPIWPNGATITWSFMTPGVALGPAAPPAWNGTNSLGTGSPADLRVKIDTVHGAGAFNAAVQRAFNTWSAAANLQFVQVADQGGAFGTVAAPDIRIGAFSFGAGDLSGAAGFGPPGDDVNFPDALAGDIAFNSANNFNIDPGAEGDPLQTGPGGLYLNDIEGLLLHEIGHTLGIGHSQEPSAILCGYQSPNFDGSSCDYAHVNRVLTPDDLNAVRNIYGPAPPPDGDVSFDCRVDAADVLLVNQILLKQLLPNAAQRARADVAPLVSGTPLPDGEVTTADFLAILQKSLRQISY
ncbi:MAG: matrixin family metalloprotease [Halioglobus sp.]|nr:matrixin family metalloprotease [Halioglobus sp.]